MLSRLTGAYQSEKASQEQVSDKAAAGVTALAKLVQIVGKDCGTQELAQAAKELVAASDETNQTQQISSATTSPAIVTPTPDTAVSAAALAKPDRPARTADRPNTFFLPADKS